MQLLGVQGAGDTRGAIYGLIFYILASEQMPAKLEDVGEV